VFFRVCIVRTFALRPTAVHIWETVVAHLLWWHVAVVADSRRSNIHTAGYWRSPAKSEIDARRRQVKQTIESTHACKRTTCGAAPGAAFEVDDGCCDSGTTLESTVAFAQKDSITISEKMKEKTSLILEKFKRTSQLTLCTVS
jgi:hypothetical protein